MTQGDQGFCLLDTALGPLGLAWSPAGMARVQLPAGDRDATARRLAATLPPGFCETDMMPPAIEAVATLLRRYALGERVDFDGVTIDLGRADGFSRAVYAAARTLGYGETTTYGELATLAGHPGKARETGQALGANPVPVIVPCHRILAAGGKLGGFSAPGGARTKERLLAMEGVSLAPPPPAQRSFAF